MKSEEVMKIFARGENQPHLFTIHFYFLLRVPIGDAMLMLYKTNLLIRRNCVRQGKASEGNEAVVTYGDLSESKV